MWVFCGLFWVLWRVARFRCSCGGACLFSVVVIPFYYFFLFGGVYSVKAFSVSVAVVVLLVVVLSSSFISGRDGLILSVRI